MTWQLIRTTGAMPPGGFQFTDKITGKSYRDMEKFFDARVQEIIRDRKANARLWTDQRFVDPTHVSKELSEQNCQRLKNNRLFCTDGTIPQFSQPESAPMPAPAGKVCRWCGATELEEVLCQTCRGRRVTGYRCRKCGKESPR